MNEDVKALVEDARKMSKQWANTPRRHLDPWGERMVERLNEYADALESEHAARVAAEEYNVQLTTIDRKGLHAVIQRAQVLEAALRDVLVVHDAWDLGALDGPVKAAAYAARELLDGPQEPGARA